MDRIRALAATLASVPITLFGLILITFLIGRVVPIDPVLAIVGDHAPQDVVARTRLELGLDKPLPEQFVRYVGQLLQGDFGRSVMTSNRVSTDIARFFPATLELATVALLIAVALGVPLGVYAAVRQGGWVDTVIRVVCLSGHSVPVFVLALLALLVFYATLQWAPGPGRQGVMFDGMVEQRTGLLLLDAAIAGEWDAFRDALRQIALPALVLALSNMAYIARMTRAFMLESLRGEYVITAKAKGLSAAADGDRPDLCRAAGGGGADRDDLQLAGTGAVLNRQPAKCRHERGAGRDPGRGADVCRAEPVVRSPVSGAGPPRAMRCLQ